MAPTEAITTKAWLPSMAIWLLTCLSCSGMPVLLNWVSGQAFNLLLAVAVLVLTAIITVYAVTGRRADDIQGTVGTLYIHGSRRRTLALSHTDPGASMLSLLMTRRRTLGRGEQGGSLLDHVILEEETVASSESVAFSPPSKHPVSAVREPDTSTRSPSEVSAVPDLYQPPASSDDQQPTCSKYLPRQPKSDEQVTLHTVKIHRSCSKRGYDYNLGSASTCYEDDVDINMEDILRNIEGIPKLHRLLRSSSASSPVEAVISVPPQDVKAEGPGAMREDNGVTQGIPPLILVPKDDSDNNEDEIGAHGGPEVESARVMVAAGLYGVETAAIDIGERSQFSACEDERQ